MRDLKIMTALVYICVAGVAVSLGGGIYTAVREHQEKSKPQPQVFPTPAGMAPGGQQVAPVRPATPGGLPTPAQ